MPRYRYVCSGCHNEKMEFHLYEETPFLQCEQCDSELPLIRALTSPLYFTGKMDNEHSRVGDITKEHIEKNREILEAERKKAKEKNYEPS